MSKHKKSKNKFRGDLYAPLAQELPLDPVPDAQGALEEIAVHDALNVRDTLDETGEGAAAAQVGEASAADPADLQASLDDAACVVDHEPGAAENALHADESLGQRLRAAREARGLAAAECAASLRLPVHVIHALEADAYERIGHGVYLRGYLAKYLTLLDLPQVLAERVMVQHEAPPPLTTAITMSRPRYLFERYSGAALYLVLTAVFVVPAVLLATRGGLEKSRARIAPLDAPAIPAGIDRQGLAPPADLAERGTSAANGPPGPIHDEPPLTASMAPFPAASPPAPAAQPALAASAHSVHLSLAEPSWVEITGANGERFEYGLLPAGSERDYASAQPLEVRIGNANGAELAIDGNNVDLAPYRRANVAHLRIADGSAGAAHGG